MSSCLYWEPIVEVESRGGWSHPLKGIIVRRYFDEYGDGSLNYPERVTLTREKDLGFLQGLDAAGVKNAEDLLEVLIKHGSINIFVGD